MTVDDVTDIVNSQLPSMDQDVVAQFRTTLAAAIRVLLDRDLNKLISALYRMDVAEKQVAVCLEQTSLDDAALALANLVIDRQMEKLRSRAENHQPERPIPDDERW